MPRASDEGTRQEPGNLRFDVLRNPEDDHSFVIYEVFTSLEALTSTARPNTTGNAFAASTPSLPAPRTKTFYNLQC